LKPNLKITDMNKMLIFFVMFLLVACENKETYLAGFARFVEEVKENGSEYTLEQWQKAERNYQHFAETAYEKYRHELTGLEKEQVGRLKAAFLLVKAKKGVKDFFKDTEDALYQIKGAVEELADSVE
jgi:hypothetical protein